MKRIVEKQPLSTEIDPETFEFKTLEDFNVYNRWARKNKVPVKIPDESFHKKVKVKFQRFDQPENVLKVRVRNRSIDWTGQLKPGKVYDLPLPVVKFINSLVEPIYGEVKVQNSDEVLYETQKVGERARFSCQVLDFGEE